jgi:hypothetical protein
MFTITKVARSALNCSVMIAFAASAAANATTPPPKPKPYQPAVHNDVTVSYEFRTRILTGKPGCQRYAAESDAAFLDDKIDTAAKIKLLKKIEAEAGANGCLAP